MNSFKKKSKKIRKKRDKKGKKDKKRKRSSSSSSDSSDSSISSSSSSSSSDSSLDKHKHKKRKHKKDRKKRKKSKRIDEKCVTLTGESSKSQSVISNQDSDHEDFSIPIHLMDNKQKAPETKEEYEKRQSVVRRVVDEETGRTRLIKGDGEVIEEIVSKDRHREINKLATQTDGQVYQNKTIGWTVTSNKK